MSESVKLACCRGYLLSTSLPFVETFSSFPTDVTNGVNYTKLHESIRVLSELFVNNVLIVEKDRVKEKGNSKRPRFVGHLIGGHVM